MTVKYNGEPSICEAMYTSLNRKRGGGGGMEDRHHRQFEYGKSTQVVLLKCVPFFFAFGSRGNVHSILRCKFTRFFLHSKAGQVCH